MDNWLFDVVMPTTNPNAFKVVCAVYRKTSGFGKWSDVISVTQFMVMIGTNSKATAQKAIDEALLSGYITRRKDGFGYRFQTQMSPESGIESEYQVIPESGLSPENGTHLSPESGTESVPENGLSPESGDTIIRINNNTELMNYFTSLTAFNPPHDTTDNYRDDWLLPAEAILSISNGDMEQAKKRVDYGLKVARGENDQRKRYPYKSLGSIKTAALNWQPSQNGSGRNEPAYMLNGL